MPATKTVERVYRSPEPHWVGDGFHVMGYFNMIPRAAARLSPFILLDYGAPTEFAPTDNMRRGVGPHPHRGFETVTIALQGSVAHHDSTGAGGVIGPGDVQWMTAGAGILHREYHAEDFARRGGTMQMAQLWVNLPAKHKMAAPGYQALTASQMGVHRAPGVTVRVIAGEHEGAKGPARTFTPMHVFDVALDAGATHEVMLPGHYNTFAIATGGRVHISGEPVEINELALFANDGDAIRLEAQDDTRLLLFSGEPIAEPIAQYGPFVMNTPEQISEALSDFHRGKFGHLDE